MKKIWVHRLNSFKEKEKFDNNYYLNMDSIERLEIVQFLREGYFKIKGRLKNEGRKRLRRSVKIIQ